MSLSFSQSAASGLVPLLARVVLAAAFVPAGYHKVMSEAEFSGEDARRLRELQIVDASAHADQPGAFLRASLVELPPAPPTAPAGATPSKPTTDEVVVPQGAGAAAAGVEPVKARGLHRITLMVDKLGWQYPAAQAWAAALTELVGGTLLLFGLFTRIWAFGLSIAMGVAFYLTSLASYAGTSGFFRAFPLDDYNRFAAQIALFALAFGVVLSGAGAASFDRLIAGSGKGAAKPPKKGPDG